MDNHPDKRRRKDGIVPPPGTMAATWFEQGFAEGLAEARAEWDREIALGMAELLLQLMELRFGDVPEAVRTRITDASKEELDAWGAALLDAPTIEDVMHSDSRH
ncbi:MAG: DUF4351 domain-containing protein [bacterium]|nr:DUF4351 domain-containing protein [bacterium]